MSDSAAWNASAPASSNDASGALPAAPVANASTVSLVEVSLSTVMLEKLLAFAAASICWSKAGPPDMATMLGFVFTDAKIPGGVLQKLLSDAADKSLNCVTVDGDTSTSDTLLLAATGVARHAPIEEADDPVLADFKRALDELLIELAQLLARDGEGATKFVTINVGGASSNGAARKIGLAVANSPLVKTAIAGEDANWGRIVMAVGKSGERADRDKLRISIGGVKITDGGQVVPNYDETPVAKHIKGTDIVIDIDLGIGRGRATVWTCDLTHGYIDINGSYRS